ncbi:hypothetical protein Csa_023666, partial [Cucumis sativus]
ALGSCFTQDIYWRKKALGRTTLKAGGKVTRINLRQR